ncbi:MAG: hypothetical protein WCG91_01615 [Candidatus Shapirobacteria bacterium]
MIWKKAHVIKIYEALSAIADDRVEVFGNEGRCFSPTGEKVWDIKYNPTNNSINSNDNSAYYTHSLSYPMIAYLMVVRVIPYKAELLDTLQNISWEDINENFKNDYDKSIKFVLGELKREGLDVEEIKKEVKKIYDFTCALKMKTLGEIQKPSRKR